MRGDDAATAAISPIAGMAAGTAVPVSAIAGLRAATGDVHERLHRHPAFAPLTRTPPDVPGYLDLLGQLHGFYAPVEACLFEGAARLLPELTDLAARRKAHLIRADRATLRRVLGAPDKVAARSFALDLKPSRPAMLGGLYVIEGATLGGRELGRALEPVLQPLGLDGTAGREFLLAYGTEQGPMWRRFCAVLAAVAGRFTLRERDLMEQTARRVFLALEDWLTRSRLPG